MSSAKNHRIRSHRSYRNKVSTAEHFQAKQFAKVSQQKVMKEQDEFSVRNFQIDVAQPTMFLPRIGKRYIFKLNQPITPPRTHNSKIR